MKVGNTFLEIVSGQEMLPFARMTHIIVWHEIHFVGYLGKYFME